MEMYLSVGEHGLQNLRPVSESGFSLLLSHFTARGQVRLDGVWRADFTQPASWGPVLPHLLLSPKEPRAQQSRPPCRGAGVKGRVQLRGEKAQRGWATPVPCPSSGLPNQRSHPTPMIPCKEKNAKPLPNTEKAPKKPHHLLRYKNWEKIICHN